MIYQRLLHDEGNVSVQTGLII